jgi:hypothetical protein
MNKKVLLIFAAIAALVVAWAGPAAATPFSLINPSFEDPPGQPGYWSGDPTQPDSVPDGEQALYPTGWAAVSGTNKENLLVDRNPTVAEFSGAGGDGTLPAPAVGSQALFNASTFNNDICALSADEDLLLTAGKVYTLTISIGRGLSDPVGWFAGFSLIAVDAYTGELTNVEFSSSENPAPGTFKDFSMTFAANTYIKHNGVRNGDELEVGVILGAGTYADNVRLDIAPEPSSLVLLASGVLGLAAYAWRRKSGKTS